MRQRRFVVQALEAQTFVEAALQRPDLVSATLQQPEFSAKALANRGFLTAVIDARDQIATQLSIKDTADRRATELQRQFDQFAALARAIGERLPMRWEDRHPCFEDSTAATAFDRHYLYHPAWAARVLARTRPAKHVDISSIVAFCSIASAFVPVDFYDFRPASIALDNLSCGKADLTQLPFADNSIPSLSCMHVLEHVGLGRYGDPLDPDGDLKAIAELVRVLAPGGDLLVATPVGRPRIQFNAHRVYDHEAFISYFAPLTLIEAVLIEEKGDGGLIGSPPSERFRAESYGCGCFWLRKPAA